MSRLFAYKKIPVPTLRGWILILFIMVSAVLVVAANLEPYLSPNAPVRGEALVVEGWMDDYALREAAAIFQEGNYRLMIITGGPIHYGTILTEYDTYAQVASAVMEKFGIPDSLILRVPAPEVDRDRTYESALTLKRALAQLDNEIRSFDLCAYAAHARRSRLLFRRALGREYRIGVISVGSSRYGQKSWWRSSRGFRSVVGEAIAYVYARLFAFSR